jgi:hypothetical protein
MGDEKTVRRRKWIQVASKKLMRASPLFYRNLPKTEERA